MRSVLVSFVQAGLLLTSSFGVTGQAAAQRTANPSAPPSVSESARRDRLGLRRAVARGENIYDSIFSVDRVPAVIRPEIQLLMASTHPALAGAARATKWSEICNPDGSFKPGLKALQPILRTRIYNAVKDLPAYQLVAPNIRSGPSGAIASTGKMHDYKTYLLSHLSGDSSVAKSDTVLAGQFLDLETGDSTAAWKVLAIEPSGKATTISQLLNPRSGFIDIRKLKQLKQSMVNREIDYVRRLTTQLASEGKTSVYDYIMSPQDPAGALQDADALTPLVSGFRDRSLTMTAPIADRLQMLPLSSVVESGFVMTAKLRDAVLEAIKDQPVSSVDLNLLTALSPEIAAVAVGYSVYHPHDKALHEAVENTRMGTFISGGSSVRFIEKTFQFGSVYDLETRAVDLTQYRGLNHAVNPWLPQPAHSQGNRIADVFGDQIPVPPPQPYDILKQAGTGSSDTFPGPRAKTTVPYSFALKSNTPVDSADISNIGDLDESTKAMARYGYFHLEAGTCAEHIEVPGALPPIASPGDAGGSPAVPTTRGVVFSGGNLNNMPINGDGGERGAAGVSFGAVDPAGQTHVDIVIHQTFDKNGKVKEPALPRLGTVIHEEEHSDGQDHPFKKHNGPGVINTLFPGTKDEPGEHSVPRITGDISGTAYKPGDFNWITERAADKRDAQIAFGSCPAPYKSENLHTISLRSGTVAGIVDAITSNRDLTVAWVGVTYPLAQIIVPDPAASFVLDARRVNNDRVFVLSTGGLDLAERHLDLDLYGRDSKTRYALTRIETPGFTFRDGLITAGQLLGTDGDNFLQLDSAGTLVARKGNDILVGGELATIFVGGEGHKTFKIRAGSKKPDDADLIRAFKVSDDIVAPSGTAHALWLTGSVSNKGELRRPVLSLIFRDAANNELKLLNVDNGTNVAVLPSQLRLHMDDGTGVALRPASEEQSKIVSFDSKATFSAPADPRNSLAPPAFAVLSKR